MKYQRTKLLLTSIAALFLAMGTAHAQDAMAENARQKRAAARCKMELMKYETMEQSLDQRSFFFTICMKAEGYSFTLDKSKYPILNNMNCDERWKRDRLPPEDTICWVRVW